MAYDYTPAAISAFKWNGATIPGDIPAWWGTLTGSGAIIYDPGPPSIDVFTGLTDLVTGVAITTPVKANNWLIKHPDDSLEVMTDDEFSKRYE